MKSYLLLGLSMLVPLVLTIGFELLRKYTKFKKIPEKYQQIIIGVLFGLAAVFGTEFGVKVGSGSLVATANLRDAAPICAGLLFGGPAGIIAGLIGGVERFFAAYWGRGTYSQLACSISTVLAGFYAAGLRRYLFDSKRPNLLFGFATGLVMEVVHLTILFITHFDEPTGALTIVQIVTFPMVLGNAVTVMFACLALQLLSYSIEQYKEFFNKLFKKGVKSLKKDNKYKKITQRIQVYLLLFIMFGYMITTSFTYVVLTGSAETNNEELLALNISDITSEVKSSSDEEISNTLYTVKDLYVDSSLSLSEILEVTEISEINYVNNNGRIIYSTVDSHVDRNISESSRTAGFSEIKGNENEILISEFSEDGLDDKYTKYAGIGLEHGFLLIGLDKKAYQSKILSIVGSMIDYRHVGTSGYIIIADETKTIIGNSRGKSDCFLKDIGINVLKQEQNVTYEAEVLNYRENGTTYLVESSYRFVVAESYYILALVPNDEIYASCDAMIYVSSFAEVIVFAILYVLIYSLLKKLVVKNIQRVNANLSDIIGGNLDVVVDVRATEEFSSLSDDINSTVLALKRYIDEAAARIDKELAFAKSIQLGSLPSVFPAFPKNKEFDIFATMDTAKEVGGDFYDFYMIDPNHLGFLIADVSGKGIPAALFMMEAKTAIKNLAATGIPVNEVITKANDYLCESNEAGMFVTCWMGILDITTGHLEFANAGLNYPLIYRNDGTYEYLEQKKNLVLAGMDGVMYKLQEVQLNPGDKIYLYTDGVTEATRGDNVLYGEDRLKAYLNLHSNDNLVDTLKGVKADVDKFIDGAPQFDDITMLSVRFDGKKEE